MLYLSTDADSWLFGVLSVDPLLQQYAPGGFWAQNPPQGVEFPCVRWWCQSPGRNVRRQDGQMSLAEAQPGYIVCMLDRQQAGNVDKSSGTAGQSSDSPTLELGARRIGELLDVRYEAVNGFQWLASIISDYQMITEVVQGEIDVMLGFWLQLRVQPLV